MSLAVACGVDFTAVATLSVDYYETIDEDFDDFESLGDHEESYMGDSEHFESSA